MNNVAKNNEHLGKLWVLCTALTDLPTQKAKGQHLQQFCKRHEWALNYLLAVMDPAVTFGTTHGDALVTCCFGIDKHRPANYFYPTVLSLLTKFAKRLYAKEAAHLHWGFLLEQLDGKETVAMAGRLLDKNLGCGLDPRTFNRVLENLGYEPIALPAARALPPGRDLTGLVVEVGDEPDRGMCHAAVWHDWVRLGDIYLDVGPGCRMVFEGIRQAGGRVYTVKGGGTPTS